MWSIFKIDKQTKYVCVRELIRFLSGFDLKLNNFEFSIMFFYV